MAQLVAIGEVAGAQGVKGRLKVIFHLESNTVALDKGTWCFLEYQKKPVPFFIEWAAEMDEGAVLQLRGIQTPEGVHALRGKRVWVPADAVGREMVVTSHDLIGYMLVNHSDGREIGRVTQRIDIAGNPLLEVDMGHDTALVPFHPSLVRHVDPLAQLLVMELAQGLFDL